MKTVFFLCVLYFLPLTCDGQVVNDTLDRPPIDLFGSAFRKTFPTLEYSYDSVRGIYNYSGNWDLDGDRKVDSILFIASDGAHMMYHLRLGASIQNKSWDFNYLLVDFPLPGKVRNLDSLYSENITPADVYVADVNEDGKCEIILRPDLYSLPSRLLKRMLNGKFTYLKLEYVNGKFMISPYG